MKYEGDVLVKFKRSGGMVVTVDKGIIEIENVPGQDPYQRFVTCGKASCASVKIEGVDVAALTMRAKTLGYGNVGAGRRADGQHSGHHRRTLQDWIKAGDAFRAHAARRGDCTCRRGLKYGKKKRRSRLNSGWSPLSLLLEDRLSRPRPKRRWGWKTLLNKMETQAEALCNKAECAVSVCAEQAMKEAENLAGSASDAVDAGINEMTSEITDAYNSVADGAADAVNQATDAVADATRL